MKLQALFPMTFSPRKVLNRLGLGALAAASCDFYYLYLYSQASEDLWYHGTDGVRYLKPDAYMPSFFSLLGFSLYGCIIAVLAMIPLAWLFWHSHCVGSKSIYTMRRLPNRWELPRRCFTIPILAGLCFVALAAVLLLLDFFVFARKNKRLAKIHIFDLKEKISK